MKHKSHDFRMPSWVDHIREKLAVWLAPWCVYTDILEYHRHSDR